MKKNCSINGCQYPFGVCQAEADNSIVNTEDPAILKFIEIRCAQAKEMDSERGAYYNFRKD